MALRSFLRRRILAPVVQQLTQGVTPRKLAAALAVGVVIAVNPFLGTVTVGCVAAGIAFRLNQPMLQLANLLATPAQLLLLVPWVRIGEWMWEAPPMPLDPAQIVAEFSAGPIDFLSRFGRTGVHAASAWLFASPILAALFYALALPVFARWAENRRTGGGNGAPAAGSVAS